MTLGDVAGALQTHQRFLVTTHQNADGDAIGSLLAMTHLLRVELEKYVVAVLPDPLVKRYQFLPGLDGLVTPDEAAKLGPWDAVVTVDVSTPERIGDVYKMITPEMVRINVDHHVTNPRTDDICWVDTNASATCEMMVDMYRELNVVPTADVATALYTGIITDTGQLAFQGTTPKAIHAAADLVDQGAEYERVAREVYLKTEEAQVRSLGGTLSRMQIHDDGRFAISWIGPDEQGIDHEGFVNHLLNIETVEVAALIRPLASGEWKLSMRSAGLVDVSVLAKKVNGGGHPLAAGGTLGQASLEEAILVVKKMCLEALRAARG